MASELLTTAVDFLDHWGPLMAVVFGLLCMVIGIVISSTKFKDSPRGKDAMIVFYSWGSLVTTMTTIGLLLFYYNHK